MKKTQLHVKLARVCAANRRSHLCVCLCVRLKINVPGRPSSRQPSKLPSNGAGGDLSGSRGQPIDVSKSFRGGVGDMSLSIVTAGRLHQSVCYLEQVRGLW